MSEKDLLKYKYFRRAISCVLKDKCSLWLQKFKYHFSKLQVDLPFLVLVIGLQCLKLIDLKQKKKSKCRRKH